MNERIKQLLLDAGGQYSSGNQNDWPSWVLGDAGVEKFAELIVRECVLETMDAIHHDTSIRLQLYKHFGIEL